MDIVIIGAGNVGRALAAGWRRAGHKVTVAVRNPDDGKTADLRREGFAVVALGAAAKAGEVIALAVPWSAVRPAIQALGPLAGKIIIDAINPLTADFELAVGHTDSAGETVARLCPGARVVKAFNTTGANNMANSKYPGGKVMMPLAGDDAAAKETVMRLAADLGFEPIDVGPLTMSRHLEPMAMLWIKLAYAQGLGREIAFALLKR